MSDRLLLDERGLERVLRGFREARDAMRSGAASIPFGAIAGLGPIGAQMDDFLRAVSCARETLEAEAATGSRIVEELLSESADADGEAAAALASLSTTGAPR